MGGSIKKNSTDLFPRNIGDMTLKELVSSKDVEIRKKDNVLKVKRRTPSETIIVEVRSYDDAAIVLQSKTCHDKPFSHMESTIEKMRAEGRTQSEVADILGTTQTNISKIEKKIKNAIYQTNRSYISDNCIMNLKMWRYISWLESLEAIVLLVLQRKN